MVNCLLECYIPFFDEPNVLEQNTHLIMLFYHRYRQDETMKSYLRSKYQCLVLSDKTPIPIINQYQRPTH